MSNQTSDIFSCAAFIISLQCYHKAGTIRNLNFHRLLHQLLFLLRFILLTNFFTPACSSLFGHWKIGCARWWREEATSAFLQVCETRTPIQRSLQHKPLCKVKQRPAEMERAPPHNLFKNVSSVYTLDVQSLQTCKCVLWWHFKIDRHFISHLDLTKGYWKLRAVIWIRRQDVQMSLCPWSYQQVEDEISHTNEYFRT